MTDPFAHPFRSLENSLNEKSGLMPVISGVGLHVLTADRRSVAIFSFFVFFFLSCRPIRLSTSNGVFESRTKGVAREGRLPLLAI